MEGPSFHKAITNLVCGFSPAEIRSLAMAEKQAKRARAEASPSVVWREVVEEWAEERPRAAIAVAASGWVAGLTIGWPFVLWNLATANTQHILIPLLVVFFLGAIALWTLMGSVVLVAMAVNRYRRGRRLIPRAITHWLVATGPVVLVAIVIAEERARRSSTAGPGDTDRK